MSERADHGPSIGSIQIDAFRYFKDALLRVATHPASRIDELTPAGWALAFASIAA